MKRAREKDGDAAAGSRPSGAGAAAASRSQADVSRQGGDGGGRPCPRLFVGGLHRSVREGDLLRLFLPFGRIVKEEFCWHTAGPRKGEPRGYAFVEYETTAEAAQAMAAMDGKELRGRTLHVRYAREQDAQPPTRKAKAATKPSSDPGASRAGNAGAPWGEEKEEDRSAEGTSAYESALNARIRKLKALLEQSR